MQFAHTIHSSSIFRAVVDFFDHARNPSHLQCSKYIIVQAPLSCVIRAGRPVAFAVRNHFFRFCELIAANPEVVFEDSWRHRIILHEIEERMFHSLGRVLLNKLHKLLFFKAGYPAQIITRIVVKAITYWATGIESGTQTTVKAVKLLIQHIHNPPVCIFFMICECLYLSSTFFQKSGLARNGFSSSTYSS